VRGAAQRGGRRHTDAQMAVVLVERDKVHGGHGGCHGRGAKVHAFLHFRDTAGSLGPEFAWDSRVAFQ
jgi:hypothetical protein